MPYEGEGKNVRYVYPGKRGELETISWDEFSSWDAPGTPGYNPFLVTPSRLAGIIGVRRSAIYEWLNIQGFPPRDSLGLLDANAVFRWREARGQNKPQGRRSLGQGCSPS